VLLTIKRREEAKICIQSSMRRSRVYLKVIDSTATTTIEPERHKKRRIYEYDGKRIKNK
jgi:hypothetical protein